MSERWPPMLGVVGFDGGYKSAVSLAIPPDELQGEEGIGAEGTGACCNADGSCTDGITQFDCTSSGGIYQGDGTDCASVDCGSVIGACCADDGTCTVTAEVDCLGTWRGAGTDCDPNLCGGACCTPNGFCVDVVSLDACQIISEFDFFYIGRACVDNPCPVGECCTPAIDSCTPIGFEICGVRGESCNDSVVEAYCDTLPDSRWLGEGTTCDGCTPSNYTCCDIAGGDSCCFDDPNYFCC